MQRMPWPDYFMSITYLVRERSTCLRRKVGAIAVKDRHILATGYNGAPSGVRLGTAALTTRGMKEDEMRQVAAFIVEAIEKRNEPASLAAIRSRVEEFARAYPLFTW